MALIKGIHHVCLKCCNYQEYKKVCDFYGDTLELPVVRKWDTGIMFDTGCGIIEVFSNADSQLRGGVIRHFALLTDSVDACVKKVTEAGYEVFIKPDNIDIPSKPIYPIRMAFCYGPLGEEIEFFEER